jgi:sugar phosphate permease
MSVTSDSEAAVLRKISRRLLPFLFTLYIVNYLDRVNVGFAALQMKSDLKLSDSVYGFGAGIFFAGYLLFQVPSNLVLLRVGARRWLSVLMIAWGIISCGMMLVHSPATFYSCRFLLGAAEAGFFPGIILYLTYWFPLSARAGSISGFMTAMPLSGVIGGPISGALLSLNGKSGIAGWQWLFLVEGAPAIILGVVVWFVLSDSPQHAAWLDSKERECLDAALKRESVPTSSEHRSFFTHIILRPETWLLSAAYFTLLWASLGVGLWLPEMVKSFSGYSDLMVGIISTIPFLASFALMSFVGARSDKTRKPHLFFAACTFAGATGFLLTVPSHNVLLSTLFLSLAVAGVHSAFGPFWAMPGRFLAGPTAAAGIAFINSLGNCGGFFGPFVGGLVKQRTGSFVAGTFVLAGVLCISGILALTLRARQNYARTIESVSSND